MFKGYRVVHVDRLSNGNTNRIVLTRWMTRGEATQFGRTLKGSDEGFIMVESKRGALYGIPNPVPPHLRGVI